jgi:hypothetical protein
MNSIRQSRRSAAGNVRSLLLMGAVLFLALVVDRAGMKLLNGVPPNRLLVQLIPTAVIWSLALLVFVPGFLLAERAAIFRGRAGPYTVVVLVGSALVAALIVPLVNWIGVSPPGSSAPPRFSLFLMVLLRIGLAAFVYAGLRERLEAAQAIQALETRRNEMMGRIAASRLEAARARVQPEAFIAEVRTLRGTYVKDPASGGVGLEALIARLRAATRSPAP